MSVIPAPVRVAAACLLIAGPALAQNPPRMEMTTEIPDGVTTPDNIETQLGDLNFFDGVPDAETTEKIYNLLDFSHAYQAYLGGLKIASMDAMLRGIEEWGPANTTVAQFSDLMDSKALFLTPNTTSVYQTAVLRMTDEPWVMETPPNVLGFVNNAWFKYVLDFGRLGPDEGQGGRFLILPPGFEGDVDEAGFTQVVQTDTYAHWVLWRGYLDEDGSPATAIAQGRETFRMYPLSQVDNPPEMTFVNVSGEEFNTIHLMDGRMFEEVDNVIQAEPLFGEEPALLGHLAAIGIVKGEEFAPDARMARILERAAAAGAVTVKTLISKPRDERAYWYPGESYWQNAFPGSAYTWMIDGVTMHDFRAAFHFYATGVTPAMAFKSPGKGSQYAFTYRDSQGRALDGSNTYRLTVPADVPAADFWSFTLYDNQTRSMLQTDKQFPALGSNDAGLVRNADGSTDIYFGPEAPEGRESNWLQTVPGKGWNVILRLYGPLEPWFDQTWRPGEIELVEAADTADALSLRITVDGRVAVYGVQFDTGSTEILPGSEATLAAIATLMEQLPALNVAVVGHTDNTGDYETNLALSKRRADAVVAELVSAYGVSEDRLFAAGASFLAPIANNATEEGRALNRRVELVRVP